MNKIQKFENGMHYIIIEDEVVQKFIAKGSNRVICIIENYRFHCAFMQKKGGGFYINLGSKIGSKLSIKEGLTIYPTFEEDNTPYKFEMPEEFLEALDQDPDAYEIFQGLTDGNKRSLIYLISLVKSSEKRIERALKVIKKLKIGITSPKMMLK